MVYFGDGDEAAGKPDGGRKRNSRRSSILKASKPAARNALQDLDVNQQDDETCAVEKSRRSKRVSFANTCQVKEFRKEFHLVEQEAMHASNTRPTENQGHHIQGLDQLLTGQLENTTGNSSAFSAADDVFQPAASVNSQSFLAKFGQSSSQQSLFMSEGSENRDDMTELMSTNMEMTACMSSSTRQYSHLSETMQRWEDQSTRVFMDSSRMDSEQANGSMDFTACIGGIATNSQPDKTINFQYDADDGGEMELTGCHTTTIRQGETSAQHQHSTASTEHNPGGSLFSFADQESKVDSSKFLSKIGMNKPVQLPDFLASDSPIQFPRRASIATSGGQQERQATEQVHRYSAGSNLKSTIASGPLSFLQGNNDEQNETRSQKVDVHSFLNKLGSGKQTEVPDFLRSPAREKNEVPAFMRSSEPEKVDVNSFLHKLGAGDRVSVPAFLLGESPVSYPKPHDAKNYDGNMERNKPSTSSNEDEGNRTRLFSENDMEFTEVIGNVTKSQSAVSGDSPAKTEGADLNEHTHIFKSGELGEDMDLTGTVTLNIPPKKQEDRKTSQASTQNSKHSDQSFTQKDLFRLIVNRKSSMLNAKPVDRAEMEPTKSEAGNVNLDDKTMVFSSHDGEMEMTTCLTDTKCVEKNKTNEGDCLDSTRNQTKVFGNDEDDMDMTSCLGENKSFAASKRNSVDQTRLFSANDGNMEMTTCLESKKTYSNDEEMGTTCVEEKKVTDKTCVFSTHDGSMEITCVEEKEAVDKTRVFSTHEGEMEITTCIDEKTTTDKTTIFSEHHGQMEITCLEQNENVDKTRLFSGHDGHMEMTACLDKTKTVDKTTIFSSNNDGMEMTCVEEKEVTCKAETYIEEDDENADETDVEKATTLSTSPSKEAEVTAQERTESLDQSCAEMNATTRIRARLAQLSQRLNSTNMDRTESITSEKASTTMREDTSITDSCKAQDTALKRIASFPTEQDELMQKKRRNTTMSESMGILDEMSLEFADNLSYEESAFLPDAPDCSELKTPQATMNETEMFEPSIHLNLPDCEEDTAPAPTEPSPLPSPIPSPSPPPLAPSSESFKSSEDGDNVSKVTEQSSLQKSMLSVSNRSMMTGNNSSIMAPKLTNINSLSHISVLQGMTEDDEPQTMNDYLEKFKLYFGQYEMNGRQSAFVPRTRKPPEQLGDYLMCGIQDIESSIYDWAVSKMTAIADTNKEKGDEIAQRLMENPPKILKMSDDAVSYQKVCNLKTACANLAKKNLKNWRAKMVKSVVEAVKEENECMSQHVQQLQDRVNRMKDMKEKLMQAKASMLEKQQQKQQKKQEEQASSKSQEIEALKMKLESVRKEVAVQKEGIDAWCKERKQPAKVEALQQMIVTLKRCCQFEVKKWRSTGAVLAFLGGRIQLTVEFGGTLKHDFMPDLPAMSIKSFSIQSALQDAASDVDKFVVAHTLGSIDTQDLAKHCTDSSCLPQVVHQMSLACNTAHQLRRDINFKRIWHDITIQDNVLDVTFSSLAARCKFHLQLTIEPANYLKAPLKYKFIPCIGNATQLEEKVRAVLSALSPAQCHITSVIDAVNYGVLQNGAS